MDSSALHVPMAKPAKTGNSILDAYKTQSKIPLYDDSSAMSSMDISGVKGRDIPLSALRPNQPIGYANDGQPIYSKNKLAEEAKMRSDITSAYRKMNGIEDLKQGDAKQDYNSDIIPDELLNDDILNYLETSIRNTEQTLAMLKSIYSTIAYSND